MASLFTSPRRVGDVSRWMDERSPAHTCYSLSAPAHSQRTTKMTNKSTVESLSPDLSPAKDFALVDAGDTHG